MTLTDFAHLVLRSMCADHQLANVRYLQTPWPDRVVITADTRDGRGWYVHCMADDTREA